MTYLRISVLETAAERPLAAPGATSAWGEVALVEKVVGYKKIKFYTHENAGYGDVRLPEMQMHTSAFWLTVSDEECARLPWGRAAAIDGLRGIGLALQTVATVALMCDPRDLGTALGDESPPADALPSGGRVFHPTLFLYEHVPGGTGIAERIWEQRAGLLARAHRLVASCPCTTGCPACVGPGESTRKVVALALLEPLAGEPQGETEPGTASSQVS